MRKLIRTLLVLVLFTAILLAWGVDYAIVNVLPYSPIRPYRWTLSDQARYSPDLLDPGGVGARWEEFDVTVEDSILLKGWFLHASGAGERGTIILLHGIGSSRRSMLPLAGKFVGLGFNCIAYDSRAHGESGGTNCTFGYYEKRDVSAYIDSALVRYPDSPPFGVFGSSFGAAVAIQALAIDERLVCGIAESPFAALRGVIHDYFREMFLLPLNFIPDAALVNSERIARFCVDSVNPAIDAMTIRQPVMIIHGSADGKISPEYGRMIYENLASVHKEWYLVPGAGHDDVGSIGGREYDGRITEFFRTYLARTRPRDRSRG